MAHPQTSHLSQKLYRYAKGPILEEDFPRPGEDVTEGDKKGNLSSAARLGEFLPAKATRNPIFQRTYVNKMEKSKNCKIF